MTSSNWIPVLHGACGASPDEQDTVATAQTIVATLRALGWQSEALQLAPDLQAIDQLAIRDPALVFNLVEALGNESTCAYKAPEKLLKAGISFTGAGLGAHLATRSKLSMKKRLREAGLPTPDWSSGESNFPASQPMIVKSDCEHASVGIDSTSVVAAARTGQLIGQREARYGHRFFSEAYIDGREFNLSVMQCDVHRTVLPVAEIEFIDFPPHLPRIVDYAAKWEPGSYAYDNTPRRFQFEATDQSLIDDLKRLALAACELFDTGSYCRVDFRVDKRGQPFILELNINPCLAPDAGFAAAAAQAGISYTELIQGIVRAAMPIDLVLDQPPRRSNTGNHATH